MRLRPRTQYVDSNDLTIAVGASNAKIPASSRTIAIPNIGMPLDRIDIIAQVSVATARTAGTTPTSGKNGYWPMGLIELIKGLRFRRFPKNSAPRTTHDVTGPGLFEYGLQVLGSPDRETMASVALGAQAVADGVYVSSFKLTLPMAHPQLADGPGLPLRCFSLADIHNDAQPPTLTIDLEDSDNIQLCTATTPGVKSVFTAASAVKLTVWPTYREADASFEKFIQDRGGYLTQDLIKTADKNFTVAATDAIKLPSPGMLTGVLLRSWSEARDTYVPVRGDCFGGSRAELRVANSPIREFTMRELANLNGESRGNTITMGSSKDIDPDGSYYLDCLTDSIGPDPSADFGSVLPLPNAIDTAIVGAFAANSRMKLLCHRFYDDLSPARFQGK